MAIHSTSSRFRVPIYAETLGSIMSKEIRKIEEMNKLSKTGGKMTGKSLKTKVLQEKMTDETLKLQVSNLDQIKTITPSVLRGPRHPQVNMVSRSLSINDQKDI